MARAILKFKLDDLRHTIKLYGARAVRDAFRAVREATEAAETRTVNAAPVGVYPVDWDRPDGGALKASISSSVRTDGYHAKGRVRVGVDYAAHVEFGTERSDAHPHLIPAAVGERKKLQERLTAILVEDAPRELGVPRITGRESPLPEIEIT